MIAAPDDVLHPFLDRVQSMQPDAEVLAVKGGPFEPDLDAGTVATGMTAFFGEAGPQRIPNDGL